MAEIPYLEPRAQSGSAPRSGTLGNWDRFDRPKKPTTELRARNLEQNPRSGKLQRLGTESARNLNTIQKTHPIPERAGSFIRDLSKKGGVGKRALTSSGAGINPLKVFTPETVHTKESARAAARAKLLGRLGTGLKLASRVATGLAVAELLVNPPSPQPRRRFRRGACPKDRNYAPYSGGAPRRCGGRSAESRGPTTGYDVPVDFFDRMEVNRIRKERGSPPIPLID